MPFIIRFRIHPVLHYAPFNMTSTNIVPPQPTALHAFRRTRIIPASVAAQTYGGQMTLGQSVITATSRVIYCVIAIAEGIILATIASRTLPPAGPLHIRILSRSHVPLRVAVLEAPHSHHKLVVADHHRRIPIAAAGLCRHSMTLPSRTPSQTKQRGLRHRWRSGCPSARI